MRNERSLKVVVALAPFAVCVLLFWPTLSGGFLSDDYAVLAALWDWSQEGRLFAALVSKFHSGLDSPSFYYRPLAMASFGANFVLTGAEPLGWRVTNLALHLTCGALVFVIVRDFAIEPGAGRARWPSALAAAVFLLFPTSAEPVAWISGRYDLLALTLMLVTLVFFLRSARWHDRWGLAALLTAACALASKESAVLLPAMIVTVAVARRGATSRASAAAIIFAGLRDAAPWILLGVAYFVMRAAIFGTPFQVYAGTSPLTAIASGAWMQSLRSASVWLDALLPLPLARRAFVIAIATLVVCGALACWRRRASRAAWLAIAIPALLSIVLLMPHVSALAPNGEQGRLFYTTAALLAILVGLAAAATTDSIVPPPGWKLQATAVGASLVLVTAELILMHGAVAPWITAGTQSRALIGALPAVADRISSAGYGFALVPDHLAGVPFGRNAQGGLMQPPSQPRSLSSRLIVQTPPDLPPWPSDAQRGLVDALRRYPLSQVWAAVTSGRVDGSALPTDYFCWSESSSAIVQLAMPDIASDADWLPAWKRSLAASPCAEAAAEIVAQ